jgi:hypothetical protein
MGEINSYKILVKKLEGQGGLDADWWTLLTLMSEKWNFRM